MRGILKNKIYLYLTEFFAGMSVMAVELAASRFMAPYFSSSQIVYTIIIGTVMIAMALGNVWGGKTADKNPDPAVLYRRMLIAGAWIAAIPFFGRFAVVGISGLMIIAVRSGFLIAAAFASCMIVFVFPLFLLGTVTPSLVRYIMENTENSGSIVGRLGAFNTIGSIIGTFLPTFVTIPSVGTAATFIIFSGILMVLAALYFISEKKITVTLIVTVIIFIVSSILGFTASFAFWSDDLKYEGESVYNYLQVKEDDRQIILSTNVLFGVQSIKMKSSTLTGMYYDYDLAAAAMSQARTGRADSELDVLVLGNGTGTYASQCTAYFEGCRIDGVEIDGKISKLASYIFDMPDTVNLYEYDGRAFLAASDKQYDVIMVDAYQDITIPFQMSTVEFFTLVREHLRPGGIMVVNMNMHSDGDGAINQHLTDTILSVFPYASEIDVQNWSGRELFASAEADPAELLSEYLEKNPDGELSSLFSRMSSRLKKSEDAGTRPLTDDRAPVEMLGMKMIDAIISDEMSYYKGVFCEKGIKGIIESVS